MIPSPKSKARKQWDTVATFFIKNGDANERKQKHRRGAICIMPEIKEAPEMKEQPIIPVVRKQ